MIFFFCVLPLIITILTIVPSVVCAGLFDEAVSGEVPLSTDDSADAAPEASPTVVERIIEKSGLSFDLSGHLRGDLFVGKHSAHSGVELKSGYGELGLKLDVNKPGFGNAFGDVRFWGGYLSDPRYFGEPEDALQENGDTRGIHTKVLLREAYVAVDAGSYLELTVGHQIIKWGRADMINPTDNLTPVDWRVRSPEGADRWLGNWALRATFNRSPVRVEGVWVPFYRASILPEIEMSDVVVIDPPRYPNLDLAKGTAAARIQLLLPRVEISLSYLFGYALQPGLARASDNLEKIAETIAYNNGQEEESKKAAVASPAVHLALAPFKHHVAGFDFWVDLGADFSLHGELAFKYPKDYRRHDAPYEDELDFQVAVPNPELEYVFGIQKTFGSVRLVGQYIGKTVFNWEALPEGSNPDPSRPTRSLEDLVGEETAVTNDMRGTIHTGIYRSLSVSNRLIQQQSEMVQHRVSARVEWRVLDERLSLSMFGMVNISTLEWLLYPKIAFAITETMWLTVGGEVYQGPSDSRFGFIDESLSAQYTELKIVF
jgi:hypothetical protein